MSTLTDFAGKHRGRSAVLLCTGKSLLHYRDPEPDVIRCGVNTALFSSWKLDYLFVQDAGHPTNPNSYVSRRAEYDTYQPRIAKFYGLSLSAPLQESWAAAGAVPYDFRYAPLIKEGSCVLEDPKVPATFCSDFTKASSVPAAAGSVTFPALQFLLSTGVSTIYIVGADITLSERFNERSGGNPNNYEAQHFLDRWAEFRAWVRTAHPNVRIVSINPVGLKGMFEEIYTYPSWRFHILAVPATVTTKAFAHCAFTQKVRHYCNMMMDAGHTVYHYGHADSDVRCTEHVPVTDNRALEQEFGSYDWKNIIFQPKDNGACHLTFERNALVELPKRYQPGDFILCCYGWHHKKVAESVKGALVVEPGIGCYSAFAPFKVFESYALMHYFYGKINREYPPFYDTVIPGFLDPSEFEYRQEKEDYFLYCGRLVRSKGLQILLELAARNKMRLVIGGQGTKDRITSGDLPKNVEFVGYLTPERRKHYMARARALICPTLYMEPFGNIAIEAAISGTPVISTDWGGFTETVLPGITGYRCRTIGQFDYAIRHIDEIKPATCYQWAKSNFSLDVTAVKYQDYFLRVWGVQHGDDFYGKLGAGRSSEEVKKRYPAPVAATDAPVIHCGLPSQGVLTGCDKNQEWLLPWWWQNYHRHNTLPVAFADFGMTGEARTWCAAHGTVVPVRHEKLTGWYLKPFAMLATPFDHTLWMDLDCEVRGNVQEVLDAAGPHVGVTLDPWIPENFRRVGTVQMASGLVVYKRSHLLINAWASLLGSNPQKYKGDQGALNAVIDDYPFCTLPQKYQALRCDPNSPKDALIFHWTGPSGKAHIRQTFLSPKQLGHLDKYATHLPVLEFLLPLWRGKPTFEHGVGGYSTPFLLKHSKVFSVEDKDKKWIDLVAGTLDPQLVWNRAYVTSAQQGIELMAQHGPFALVMIDGATATRSTYLQAAFQHATAAIVAHDAKEPSYGYDKVQVPAEWFRLTALQEDTHVWIKKGSFSGSTP